MLVSRLVFHLSTLFLAIVYGMLAAILDWFPYPYVQRAFDAAETLAEHWQNDFGEVPTRHLVAAAPASRQAFTVHREDAMSPGGILIGGLTPQLDHPQGVILYDAMSGEVRHRWVLDYERFDPDGRRELNVILHGVVPFEDGSIAVVFDHGNVIVRVDACGEPLWVTRGKFHHSLERGRDNTLITWREESIVRLDADTGEILEAFDLRNDMIEAGQLQGAFAIRTEPNRERIQYVHDPFHNNDVEELDSAMADAFPRFEAGDLLVSLRDLNLVGVIDPSTRRFRWYRHGPWFKQHDPDFQSDGTISVYDNRMGLGSSRIVSIDPESEESEVLLDDSPQTPFYSWRRGKHQRLEDGALLVTESERGRVFEISADGHLIWERQMIYDEARNHIVTSAERLSPGFFASDTLDCSGRR